MKSADGATVHRGRRVLCRLLRTGEAQVFDAHLKGQHGGAAARAWDAPARQEAGRQKHEKLKAHGEQGKVVKAGSLTAAEELKNGSDGAGGAWRRQTAARKHCQRPDMRLHGSLAKALAPAAATKRRRRAAASLVPREYTTSLDVVGRAREELHHNAIQMQH
jgi:hypothetical protein